jgi:hypothetical protein
MYISQTRSLLFVMPMFIYSKYKTIFDVGYALGSLHRVDMRSAADVSEVHASHLQDSEGGESMYLRNVSITAHIHTVQRPKSRINLSYCDSLKSVKTILTDTNPTLKELITLSYVQSSKFRLPLFL